jgi:hypothetical protein
MGIRQRRVPCRFQIRRNSPKKRTIKKLPTKNSTEKSPFSFFTHVRQTFFATPKPNAQETAQKIKDVSNKCVPDINFASIRGSALLNFLKGRVHYTLVCDPSHSEPKY